MLLPWVVWAALPGQHRDCSGEHSLESWAALGLLRSLVRDVGHNVPWGPKVGRLDRAHPANEPHLPGDPAGRGEGDCLFTRKCTWVTSKGFVVLGCNCQEFQLSMKHGGTGQCSWEQVRGAVLCLVPLSSTFLGTERFSPKPHLHGLSSRKRDTGRLKACW